MTPEYLAGFFDGEGCIDVQRMYPREGKGRLYVRPRVRLAQTASCRVVLDRLQAEYGGHIRGRKHGKGKQQDSLSWEFLDRAGLVRMLNVMIPHLVVKKEQAKLALWWLENASGRSGHNGRRPQLEQARQLFMDELKAMKRDPSRDSETVINVISPLLD